MAVPDVQLVVGDHAVRAGADQAERHGQGGHVQDQAGPAADPAVAPVGDQQGNQDAEDDADRVCADRDRRPDATLPATGSVGRPTAC